MRRVGGTIGAQTAEGDATGLQQPRDQAESCDSNTAAAFGGFPIGLPFVVSMCWPAFRQRFAEFPCRSIALSTRLQHGGFSSP